MATAVATTVTAPKMNRQQVLSFYMGKNTPERKDCILENLVMPLEE